MPQVLRRLPSFALLAVLGSTMVGCGGRQTPALEPREAAELEALRPRAISFSALPATVGKILATPKQGAQENKERIQALLDTIAFQLARARTLQKRGEKLEAGRIVEGVFLLPRPNEPFAAALLGNGDVLLRAAHERARSGDAARARLLYELAKTSGVSASESAQIDAHLLAIEKFRLGTKANGVLFELGDTARDSLARASLEPTLPGDEKAAKAVVDWIGEAATFDPEAGQGGLEDRDAALEAYQAVRGGPPMLIALGMMRGNSRLAVDALDEASLGRALPPGMRLRLEAAEGGNSREALLDLFRFFDAAKKDDGAEVGFDKKLAIGAAFGTARALYEKGTGRLDDAMPLAMTLLEVGMPEIGATLISRAARLDTPPEALAFSVGVILRAIMELAAAEQVDAVTTLFEETAHLREVLLEPRNRALLPVHERLVTMVANVHIQHARVDSAIELLKGLGDNVSSPQTYLRLADLLLHKEELGEAKTTIAKAISLAEKAGDVTTEAVSYEKLFVLERARGDTKQAETNLGLALARTLTARGIDLRGNARPGIERLLARILEHYGEAGAVGRAYQRALEYSQGKPEELTATVTDLARSGITILNSRLSSLAMAEVDADSVEQDQRVYVALWHKLALRQRGEKPDGRTSSVLLTTTPRAAWVGEVRKFALDHEGIDTLKSRATTVAERTEADFYAAFQTKEPDRALLAKVAKSDAVDLVEVRIAKDRLAPKLDLKLPPGTTLP